jgi:hypothetical protein
MDNSGSNSSYLLNSSLSINYNRNLKTLSNLMSDIIKVIIAVILSSMSLFLMASSLSNTTEGHENFVKGVESIPNDRYLQAKVIVNDDFELTAYAFICPSYIPDDDSLYVLETVAGFSKKHGIKVGTDVDFQLIR